MRDSKLQKGLGVLLTTLASGAPITIGLRVLPGRVARRHFRDFESLAHPLAKRTVAYARAKGYLSVSEHDGQPVLSLTPRGKKRLVRFRADSLRLKKPSYWDGRWRVVLFDIPHEKKGARDLFRGRLKQMGFTGLQDSVWVSPYPSYQEVSFVAELYGIAPYVRFLLVKELDRDQDLRTHFGL